MKLIDRWKRLTLEALGATSKGRRLDRHRHDTNIYSIYIKTVDIYGCLSCIYLSLKASTDLSTRRSRSRVKIYPPLGI